MLKQRTIALLLAGSIALALGGTIAAVDPGEETKAAEQAVQDTTQADLPAQEETPAGTLPDEAGTLSFSNLAQRIRENDLNVLMLEESIQAIEVLDYDKMSEDLRKALNQIADAQWYNLTSVPMMGSMISQSMQSSYDSLKATFETIRDGELQADNAALVRQLENAQDQVVMAGETLYAALLSMEDSYGALERQLAALDRQIEVAELSYEQGNVSALTLQQAKAGRVALVSGMETLKMNLNSYTMQLESLVGEALTGTTRLQSLPQVSAEQLSAMEEAADLAAAKAASYELLAAQRTLDDAKESYDDAVDEYGSTSKNYNFLSAKHQWQAAQYTYDAAVQSYELKFKTLFLQVKDYAQIYEAAKVALEAEEASCAAQELKFTQGSISQNNLLDARDSLSTAREKVAGAALDLFTSYNNYRWAVEHGILN